MSRHFKHKRIGPRQTGPEFDYDAYERRMIRQGLQRKKEELMASEKSKRKAEQKAAIARAKEEAAELANPIIPTEISYIGTCASCNRKIELIRRHRKDGQRDEDWMKAGLNCGLAYKQVDTRSTTTNSWERPDSRINTRPPTEWHKRLASGKWNNEPIDVTGRPWAVYQRGTVQLIQQQKPVAKSVLCLNCKTRIQVSKFERLAT